MQKSNTLNHISILFFIFVMLLLIINLFTTNNYGRANSQVVEYFNEDDYILNFHELHSIIDNPIDNYQFVDLRGNDDFISGHLPGALNIPVKELLSRNNLKVLRNSGEKISVLYAQNEATAHTARMLLLSKGLDTQIKVLAGGYDKAVEFVLEQFHPAFAAYKDEKARFDYRRFMQSAGAGVKTGNQSQPGAIPEIKTQTVSVQGGC
jgi:rhodanese-related sulfurtransferase